MDCAALDLLSVKLESLHGMLFVNLDSKAAPLSESKAALVEDLARSEYPFGEYRHHARVVREGAFNWKTWVDGFQECYHCPSIHPIFNKDFALAKYRVENRERYAVHSCERKAESASPSGRREGLWLWLFPNLGLPCYQPCWYTLSVNPKGPGRTELSYHFHFAEPLESETVREFLKFIEQVTNEDIAICEAVQKNLEAGAFVEGRLNAERENGVLYFHQLVREAVGA